MAGKITPVRQNKFHKFMHRFTSTRVVINFFAPRMHILDFSVLKLTGGKYAASELAGWTIIQLTTIGAKTGQERVMPVLAGIDGDKVALIASSYGREHNPGWYYNLRKNPECQVTYKGQSYVFVAREVTGDEYDTYWNVVASTYPLGFDKYKKMVVGRHIPVMLLEPKT